MAPSGIAPVFPVQQFPQHDNGEPVGEEVAAQSVHRPQGQPTGRDAVLLQVVHDPPREGGPVLDAPHDEVGKGAHLKGGSVHLLGHPRPLEAILPQQRVGGDGQAGGAAVVGMPLVLVVVIDRRAQVKRHSAQIRHLSHWTPPFYPTSFGETARSEAKRSEASA